MQLDSLFLFSLSVCVYSVCHHLYSITQTEIKNTVPVLQYCIPPTLPRKSGNNDTPGKDRDTPRLLRDAGVMERKLRKATKELLAEAESGRFCLWLRKRQRNWGKTTEPQHPAPSSGGDAHVSTSDFAAVFPALNKQLTRTLVLPRRYDTMLK